MPAPRLTTRKQPKNRPITSRGTTSFTSAPWTELVTMTATSNMNQNSANVPRTHADCPGERPGPSAASIARPITGENASPTIAQNAGGVESSRNGMRRPNRPRCRSLR